jgi:hypothetical protein
MCRGLEITYAVFVNLMDVSNNHIRLIIYVVHYQTIHLLSNKGTCHFYMGF